MTIHTTSLELSKKLKEMGVKQESQFKWHWKIDTSRNQITEAEIIYYPQDIIKSSMVSAFLSSELGEILISKKVGYTQFMEAYSSVYPHELNHESERLLRMLDVESVGKMLAYLLENKIIEL